MKVEAIQELTNQALETLTQSLEQGKSEQMKRFLETMAKFHRYSWNNALLIAFQYPKAKRVAGFHAWKKMERFVKKREKAIYILAPIMKVIKEEEEKQESPSTEESPNPAIKRLMGFKSVCVFDIAQTEGKPLPEMTQVHGSGLPKAPHKRSFSVYRSRVWRVSWDPYSYNEQRSAFALE